MGKRTLDIKSEQNPEIVCQFDKKIVSCSMQQKVILALFSVLTS
jgi:hypothetical protein